MPKASPFITTPDEAKRFLSGEAMPDILHRFAKLAVGQKIKAVGYVVIEKTPWPALQLDNGEIIMAQRDDEGNGPGVFVVGDEGLCETHLSDAGRKLMYHL
jgi:hypothetical protein